jgi:hypothetical protein
MPICGVALITRCCGVLFVRLTPRDFGRLASGHFSATCGAVLLKDVS